MKVNEVDRPWTSSRQDAEVVAFGVKRIEGAQRIRRWMISARGVRFCAEPRFQRHCGNPIPGLRGDGPCADVRRSKAPELPERFIIEIPAWMLADYSLRDSSADYLPA